MPHGLRAPPGLPQPDQQPGPSTTSQVPRWLPVRAARPPADTCMIGAHDDRAVGSARLQRCPACQLLAFTRASVAKTASRPRRSPADASRFWLARSERPQRVYSVTRDRAYRAWRVRCSTNWRGVCGVMEFAVLGRARASGGSPSLVDEFEQKCVLVVEDNGRLRATVGRTLALVGLSRKRSGRWSRGIRSSSCSAAGRHPD
jgi:hypothetical protein